MLETIIFWGLLSAAPLCDLKYEEAATYYEGIDCMVHYTVPKHLKGERLDLDFYLSIEDVHTGMLTTEVVNTTLGYIDSEYEIQ